MDRAIKLLLDRQEISDLIYRYGSSLDDRDWARLSNCFTSDAVAVYGAEIGRQNGYAAIENICRTFLEPLDSSQHLISNLEIEIEGDTARSRCYLHAQHTKAGTPGGDNLTIGGRYIDELIRTFDGWRIRKRELRVMWQEGNHGIFSG